MQRGVDQKEMTAVIGGGQGEASSLKEAYELMDRDLQSGQDLAKAGMILVISKKDQVMIGLDPECGRIRNSWKVCKGFPDGNERWKGPSENIGPSG